MVAAQDRLPQRNKACERVHRCCGLLGACLAFCGPFAQPFGSCFPAFAVCPAYGFGGRGHSLVTPYSASMMSSVRLTVMSGFAFSILITRPDHTVNFKGFCSKIG